MKQHTTLLVVRDMERSVEFYKNVLRLDVELDFGANKTLTGGIALQTLASWKDFIGTDDVSFGGNDSEIYFEEDDFDAFATRLSELDIEYVHPVKEHAWGQHVVRFYDPDRHIIKVGENMTSVVHRFAAQGMNAEKIAARMAVPKSYVEDCLK